MENNYSVYMHICPNGKKYIGITKLKVESRWKKGEGYKSCILFYRSIQKYGWVNVEHKTLYTSLTKEEAEQKEIELISFYKSNNRNYGYNIANGGHVNSVSEQTKEKISINTKKALEDPAIRKKISIAQHNRPSPLKGRKLSEEHKSKMNHYGMIGRHHTKESKEKMREKAIGRKHNENTKEKLRKINTGKHLTEEIKKKISEKTKGHQSYTKGKILTSRKKVLCLELNKMFNSITLASNETSASAGHISQCCNNKYGRKTAGGYHWQYYELDKIEDKKEEK